MKGTIIKFSVMSLLSIFGIGAVAQNLKNANKLFKAGKFYESQKDYSAVLEKNPNNLQALIYSGYYSLLINDLNKSEKLLTRAKQIKPKMSVINDLLAQVYYRKKDFSKAAPLFRELKREGMAKKMESFVNCIPYEIDTDYDVVSLKFLITDPLPVVEVTINEKYKGYFFIDTGGGELILEEEFAKKVQPELFESELNEFGGGMKGNMVNGKIMSINLGDLVVKNVPIVTINLRNLEIGGYKVDGCIGTVFLYQFLSTIDYKNGQLILRNKAKHNFENILKNNNSSIIIPFEMADDHFMVARGSVNKSDTMLFFVDTGLAGNAFTCPKSTMKKARLIYKKENRIEALGGGGFFDAYPLDVDKICLGTACIENLHGAYGPFPRQLEKCFGFTINGLISHEFFRKYSFTIDFNEMKFILSE